VPVLETLTPPLVPVLETLTPPLVPVLETLTPPLQPVLETLIPTPLVQAATDTVRVVGTATRDVVEALTAPRGRAESPLGTARSVGTGGTTVSTLRDEAGSAAVAHDGGSGMGTVLAETVTAARPTADTASGPFDLAPLAAPDLTRPTGAFLDPFASLRPATPPWLDGSSLQPVLTARGADAEKASQGTPLGPSGLPELPISLAPPSAGSAAFQFEFFAAFAIAMLLAALRLGRWLRPTPDLVRLPQYVPAIEVPG
jgi:hypothetical protein